MKELALFGENPMKKDEHIMIKVKDNTIGLAKKTTKSNMWYNQLIEVKLPRNDIHKIAEYLFTFLY